MRRSQTVIEPERGVGANSPRAAAQVPVRASEPVPVRPLRARRRPALVALAVALIALGGGTGAWLLTRSGEMVTVLAVAEPVARGEVIEAADLTTTELPVDLGGLDVVAYEDLAAVVGQVATADLLEGTLLTPTGFTSELVPAAGASVVGVALTSAQMPGVTLSSGDQVRFVSTPPQGGELPVTDTATIAAEVINVQTTDAGVVVNVEVPTEQAPALAAMAATTRIALVLDPVGD